MTTGVVHVLESPSPESLCLAADQGRESFRDWLQATPSLASGADPWMPRKKCLENWAMRGALAQKSSELDHNRGHFLWVSWGDQGLAWRVSSLAPLCLSPFPPCGLLPCPHPSCPASQVPQGSSAPQQPRAPLFPQRSSRRLPQPPCPSPENPRLFHECTHSHGSLFSADRRDTQLAAVWKSHLACLGSHADSSQLAAHMLHLPS